MVKFFGVSCISTGFQQAVISKSAIWKVQERQLPVYQVRTLAREIIKPWHKAESREAHHDPVQPKAPPNCT